MLLKYSIKLLLKWASGMKKCYTHSVLLPSNQIDFLFCVRIKNTKEILQEIHLFVFNEAKVLHNVSIFYFLYVIQL